MKAIVFFWVAVGSLVSACSAAEQDIKRVATPATEGDLFRTTWISNSCMPQNPRTECWEPESFRRGDLLHLRPIVAPETTPPQDLQGAPIALTFVQSVRRDVNLFFGTVRSFKEANGRQELEVEFYDDPPGSLDPRWKLLTVRHVRVAGDGTTASDCEDELRSLAGSDLQSEYDRICDVGRYPTLVYWRICTLDADRKACSLGADGDVGPTSPPHDGQGTGSGND